MAIDRQGGGLVVIRICLGVFFVGQAIGKLRWLLDSSMLRAQFTTWLMNSAPDSIGHAYLQRFAVPGATVFARLVPLGELACGVALVVGFSTSLVACLAFVMVLNYQIASGAIFDWSFLADFAGLPVLASTLGLAIGGSRLPWSIRR